MNANQILSVLLSKGYFPSELPPVFTTEEFGRHSQHLIKEWKDSKVFDIEPVILKKKSNNKRVRMSGSYIYSFVDTDAEILSKPKRGYERRSIHVTHPIPQLLLTNEIAQNWSIICRWISKQAFTLDRLDISKEYPRGINEINFLVHQAKQGFIEASANWLVKTDITRFYPSIYTHSIPWASYGKEKVKRDIGMFKGTLADRLDLLIRKCNRNQTIGIPIGPETSRVIAEIISASIDSKIMSSNEPPNPNTVDRLQDDWLIGAPTLEYAEQILSRITHYYREYNLEINGSKTDIKHIISVAGVEWRSELASFLSHKPGRLSGSRLQEFFQLSLRLQSKYTNDAVLSYAISAIENTAFDKDDIEALESFLLKASIMSPISLDRIARLIINIAHQSTQVSRKRVRDRFRELAESKIENGYDFEAMWLIYTIRGMGQTLYSKRIAEYMVSYNGACIPLILLDLKQRGLFPCKLPKDLWERDITPDRIYSDSSWLLAYEGIRKGWLKDPYKLMTTNFFREMDARDVVFYDEKKNVKKTSAIARIRRVRISRQRKIALKFLQAIRNIDSFFESEY